MKIGRISGGRKPLWALVIIITIIAIVLGIYFYKKEHKPDYSLTATRVVSLQEKNATTLVDAKNYKDAELSYISAATAASISGDNKKAISILQDGIKKIPDQYLSWKTYDNLATFAKQTNDKKLEVDSIKTSQLKLKGVNNDYAKTLEAYYEKRLKELGAS